MFKIKDTVYSDAGKLLVGEGKRGYQFKGELSEFQEVPITLDNLKVCGAMADMDGVIQMCGNTTDYGKLKANMIRKRYTPDDQIAIMLNKDDDEESALKYEKMQEWREWSGTVAKAILAKKLEQENA